MSCLGRVIGVNRFYAPDHSATAQLLTDLAEHLAAAGVHVTVVTSRQRYDDAKAELPATEVRHGVTVRRVWTSRFGRHWLPGRLIDYVSFYVAALIALLRLTRRGDTVLAKTDPPLISVVAWLAAWIRGARLVNWCQDLFPEVAASLGLRWAAGPVGRELRRLRNRSLRAAELNVALCERMAKHLMMEGVPSERITVIHNWADGELIRPISREHNGLHREWGLEGRRVIGYSGNLGRAHDLAAMQAFVTAMSEADPALLFLFIGGGAGFAELQAWARNRRFANVMFRPYQPRERLAESLSVPDAHLVSLDPACEGLMMPSKLYGVLAAGRPLIVLGDPEGSVGSLVRQIDVGLIWAPGRVGGVLDLIERSRDPHYVMMVRQAFERAFGRQNALRRWMSVLGLGEATLGDAWLEWERAA